MAGWSVDGGNLYLHGVKVPGIKSVDFVPEGREEIFDYGPNGEPISKPGPRILGELVIRVIDLPVDSKLELHPDLRDQVIDDLMARILRLEKEKLDLTKALRIEIINSDGWAGGPYKKPSDLPEKYIQQTIKSHVESYNQAEKE